MNEPLPGDAIVEWNVVPVGDDPVDVGRRVRRRSRRTDVTTIRALTAGATALLVTFLVASYSQAALGARTETNATRLEAGSVELSDDDDGETLFDVSNMLPDTPVSRCITVDYTGNVVPAPIGLSLVGGGELARSLDLRIESGTGGTFASCAGFAPQQVVHDGRLGELLGEGVEVFAWEATPTTRTRVFRFTFVMDDAARSGADATANFVWRTNL